MEVRIEKQADGSFTAYSVGVPGIVAIGTGLSVREAKADFENSLEEIAEDMSPAERAAIITTPEYHFDISSLFEYYKVINISAFAKRLGMNDTLLRQYKQGNTYISDKQLDKIESGIHTLGRELCELRLS